MKAIYKKEMNLYFHSSIAYVFIAMFLLLAGLLYGLINLANQSSDIPGFIAQFSILSILLMPVLTMRMFCKEFQDGTHKLLFSTPTHTSDIVLGKFFAASSVLLLSLLLSLVFVVITSIYGAVYFAETTLAYLGLFFINILFLAIDMFISSFAKKQFSAIIFGFGVNLFLWFIDLLGTGSQFKWLNILEFMSPYQRVKPFMMGQLSYASIAFFVLGTCVFVFASTSRLNFLMFGGRHEK